MRISGPEIEALLQQMQVPAQFNPTTVAAPQAIHPSEELFNILDNNVKFKEKKGEKEKSEDEEEEGRIRYLGYFLAQSINFYKPINMTLDFEEKLKDKDIVVLLRSFKLGSKNKLLWHQSFNLAVKVDPYGIAAFTIPALVNIFADLNIIYGICVFIIRVKEKPVSKTVDSQQEETIIKTQTPKQIRLKSPNINIRKHIDTTV